MPPDREPTRLAWTEGAFLHEVLARACNEQAGAIALIDHDREFSYAELHERACRAAAVIASVTAPGDRVLVVGENHWSWVDAYYGVPLASRILVFGNPRLAPPELHALLERSGATVLVGPRAELERIGQLPPNVTTTIDLDQWDAAIEAVEGPGITTASPSASIDDPAWIIYTSGTTGRSKGAVLTHRSVLAAVRATDACRVIAADDVYLLPFPLCHVAGYNVVHHHARGRPVVLMPRFDPAGFVDTVARHHVTSASLAATMLHGLLGYLDEHPDRRGQLASLRLIAYGAAPMPTPLLQRAHATLGVDFTQGYGMTELSGNAVFLDVEAHRRGLTAEGHLLRTAGRPAPGVTVRVVDDDGTPLPVGTPGEIVVRAEQVMAGYWEEPEATEVALAGGWLHTGDVGQFDGDGFLTIVDRKKDVIVTGGENVSSLEVEQVLHTVAGVGEVAVVGVPDPHWGENVCAVVVPRRGETVDPEALVAAARERLAGFKVPRHVVITDALPKNATGKIVKADVRAWLAARPDLVGPRR